MYFSSPDFLWVETGTFPNSCKEVEEMQLIRHSSIEAFLAFLVIVSFETSSEYLILSRVFALKALSPFSPHNQISGGTAHNKP